MKKKQKISQNIISLLIFSVITIFVCVGLSLYRNIKKPVVVEISAEELEPLNPDFDLETLELLKARISFSQEEIESAPEIIKISAEIDNQETATESAEIEAKTENIEEELESED